MLKPVILDFDLKANLYASLIETQLRLKDLQGMSSLATESSSSLVLKPLCILP